MQNPSRLVSAHSQRFQGSDLLLPTVSLGSHYRAYHIHPEKGCGSSDMYDFERLCLGRGNVCFNQPMSLQGNMPFSLGVTIFLCGARYFVQRNSGKKYQIAPPQVLLRKGEFGIMDIYLPAHTPITTLSLDFTVELREKITPSAINNPVARFFQTPQNTDILLLEQQDSRIFHLSRYLLGISQASRSQAGISQATNELDLLHIEGQALTLLSALFTLPAQPAPGKYYKEIEAVISILQSHYHEKITIPQLARQSGMNECYLKRYFKRYTGMTISAFLEKYRMDLALMLFSQGKTAYAVSCDIGYDNFYYFKRIFKKHFGYFPEH